MDYEGILKKHKKCIASVCAISQFIALFAMPSFAYSSDDVIDNSSEAILENESSSGTAEALSSPTGSSSPDLTYSWLSDEKQIALFRKEKKWKN